MKKIFLPIVSCVFCCIIVSCEEWGPVMTFKHDTVPVYSPVKMTANKKIIELKSLYVDGGKLIDDDIVIEGKVISDDRTGNVYRSLMIQDGSGAIELKMGKTSLYNDYKLGQTIYVKCKGLKIGSYEGMLQLGLPDATQMYETSYMDVQSIIDAHVFRGEQGEPLQPKIVQETDLLKEENLGCYVTLRHVRIGDKPDDVNSRRVFCIAYVNPKKNSKSPDNRFFISDGGFGINTWAMSKDGFVKYLKNGNFDNIKVGSKTVADLKDEIIKNASAYAVSHYFVMGKTKIQIRTSGYAGFADHKIDDEIMNGAFVSLTGILTKYRRDVQFTLLDADGVKIEK